MPIFLLISLGLVAIGGTGSIWYLLSKKEDRNKADKEASDLIFGKNDSKKIED